MRIQICGALAIERDGQRLDAGLPGRQGRLLFTYLVVNRHRHVPRDELAEAMWREPDPAAADARLNPLLSKLRRVFGADTVDGRSTIRLRLPTAWIDLEAAAEAIHRAESSIVQQDWARAWGPALTALFVAERDFLPGEGRLVYIAGHRTTYSAPFAQINLLRRGDTVTIRMPYGTFRYRVTRHRIVPATDVGVLRSGDRELLILQSCHPRFSATHRYLVYALPRGSSH